jgi:hypothetical protein
MYNKKQKKKTNLIVHVLLRNCILNAFLKGREEKLEGKGMRGRRHSN